MVFHFVGKKICVKRYSSNKKKKLLEHVTTSLPKYWALTMITNAISGLWVLSFTWWRQDLLHLMAKRKKKSWKIFEKLTILLKVKILIWSPWVSTAKSTIIESYISIVGSVVLKVISLIGYESSMDDYTWLNERNTA